MKLKILTAIASFAWILVVGYVFLVEPFWLRVRTVPVPVSTVKGKTLRIVHVSDFHWRGGPVTSLYLTHAFRTVAALRPDLILITGDFMGRKVEDPQAYAAALKNLSAAAPTFAVAGNHDGGAWVYRHGGYANTDSLRAILEAADIRYLENAFTCPEIRALKVCLGGAGDLWAGLSAPQRFVGPYDSAAADLKIMMLHNPDAKASVINDDWDLMVAGHTHGGQVVLPFIGAPWTPVRDQTHLRGLFRYAGRLVHITPGVGTSGNHGRFNCRPEISVLEVAL